MTNHRPLSEKVAIVTGSSRGIGRAIAERLAKDGAAVVVNYLENRDAALEVVSGINKSGGLAIAVQGDMGDTTDIRRLLDETMERFKRIDIFVHSSARFRPSPIAEVSEEEFDASFRLNAKGTFFALKEASLRIRDGGRIIFISSCSTSMSLPGFAVYVGSKAAGELFARSLSHEVGARGITVNIVSPGFTETDMLPADPGWRKMGADMSVFKRLGQPVDIANVVAFLVSEEAAWVTGQNILASGGVGS